MRYGNETDKSIEVRGHCALDISTPVLGGIPVNRDFSYFPNDDPGEVLWFAHQESVQLGEKYRVRFAIVFPKAEDSLRFGLFLLRQGYWLNLMQGIGLALVLTVAPLTCLATQIVVREELPLSKLEREELIAAARKVANSHEEVSTLRAFAAYRRFGKEDASVVFQPYAIDRTSFLVQEISCERKRGRARWRCSADQLSFVYLDNPNQSFRYLDDVPKSVALAALKTAIEKCTLEFPNSWTEKPLVARVDKSGTYSIEEGRCNYYFTVSDGIAVFGKSFSIL